MNPNVPMTEFSTPNGLAERYVAMASVWEEDFEGEAARLLERYDALTPDPDSEILLRFHLSDITNQSETLRRLLGQRNAFVSIVGQVPGNGSRIALQAWQNDGYKKKILLEDGFRKAIHVSLEHYSYMFSGSAWLESDGGYDQTLEEYANLDELIRDFGGTVLQNLQKSWLFFRDIDNCYNDFVKARKPFFESRGLTYRSHFVSSSGVEAQSETPSRLVKMESISLFGHSDEQIVYMEALEDMYPPRFYGVEFERGTRVEYGDRSVYFIAGTTSVDEAGNTLYEGDAVRQTSRVLHNLRAILSNYEASLDDVRLAVFYVRDLADTRIVQEAIATSELAAAPYLVVQASVADPSWLVGADVTVVNGKGNPRFPPFK